MNNMYDILAKFNSAAGPAKTTLTENVDPVAFAALAPPKDKITFADKIAGAKKEVDEMLGDVAAEAMKKAVVGLKNEAGMEEGSTGAAQRKIIKKNGKPVGEVGIDPDAPPGRPGQWYMKHYASGHNLGGYDSREEAMSELKHCMSQDMEEGSTGDYSAKKARAGKDIGKPGKQFAKIAKSAAERYGSKERGEKVAGAVLAKLRKGAKEGVEEADMEEGNDFTGARLAAIKAGKPTFKVDGKVYKVTGDTSDERKQVDELDISLIKAAQKHAKEHPTKKDPESERNIHKKYGYRTDRDDTGNDDDYDEWGNEKKAKKSKSKDKDEGPKKKGRPKGTGRSIGAKGPTGKSKLLKKGAIKEEGAESPEIEEAIEMLKNCGYTVTKGLEEKAVSKAQRAAAGIAYAAKKGEIPKSKLRGASKEMAKMGTGELKKFAKTKEKGLPEKVKSKKEESKEEVEETTVSGAVATAPAAEAPKAKGRKGSIQFGKGVYESKLEESYKSRLERMLTEGISINASQGEDGNKSLTVNATDEDAVKLAQLLQLAGMPQGHDYHDVCPKCGQSLCGCEEVEESLANSPDEVYANTEMINTQGEDLHKPKSTGQTTVPILNKDAARQGVSHEMAKIREEAESRLWKLYQKYEG